MEVQVRAQGHIGAAYDDAARIRTPPTTAPPALSKSTKCHFRRLEEKAILFWIEQSRNVYENIRHRDKMTV